ncbi:RNA ligase (ATP) [Nocardia goodfellowii]|uniref:RNA ligase (TIGR02306 family) n=1 Tax=Nocardia goodfellowii TaxID=882446 RepID=A0ABS4Q9D8_9NOCA|nr:RNA ligase (ATP) [Nocardia goodfellowii]MBP2188311.1 RNA ligase (TIGR02306 family) [Nocardia goodfellowii]
MSTLSVTVEELVVHPHANADRLELAQVGLYRAVVAKSQFATGDYALYIPEQAILPEPLIEELGLTGKLAGPQRNRVKTVRLRGEVSQGIVCRPAAMAGTDLAQAAAERTDFAELLGITKWVPPIPVAMSGQVEPAPELIRWIDVENIKRYPGIFEVGEPVVATEKIHGSACLMTYIREGDRVQVSSKGIGGQSLALVAAEGNLYWRAVQRHGLPEAARKLSAALGLARVAFFGEVYGQGVQDLHYGAAAAHDETLGYALFDIAIDPDPEPVRWLSHAEIGSVLSDLGISVPRVPVLYEGPYDAEALLELAEGAETVTGTGANIREGLVVRPAIERYAPVLGGRAIGKIVSDAYLLRDGGTEYE